MIVSIASAGKPTVKRDQDTFVSDLRKIVDDNSVDLLLLTLEMKGTVSFKLRGMVLTVTQEKAA